MLCCSADWCAGAADVRFDRPPGAPGDECDRVPWGLGGAKVGSAELGGADVFGKRCPPPVAGDSRAMEARGREDELKVLDVQVELPSGPPEDLAPASSSFVAQIDHSSSQPGGLGMTLDSTRTDHLRVNRISDAGPVAEYNSRAEEDRRIIEGDYVVSVNGVASDSAAMMAAVGEHEGPLELEIRRAHHFVLRGLDKSKAKLGLDLAFHRKTTSAYVAQVFPEGVIQAHNERNPALAVRPGDRIVAVNGHCGMSPDLLFAIGCHDQLELTFSRPSGD